MAPARTRLFRLSPQTTFAPSGNYVVGGRLTDPVTGETIAQSSFRFQK